MRTIATPQRQTKDRPRIESLAPQGEELPDDVLEHVAGGMSRPPVGGTTYFGPDEACWDPFFP